MKDFLNIYQFIVSTDDPESDHSTLNILINLERIKSLVKFAEIDEGYCAQLVTIHQNKLLELFKDKILGPKPIIRDDRIVTNTKNIPFVLVHQYEGITSLKDIIDKR